MQDIVASSHCYTFLPFQLKELDPRVLAISTSSGPEYQNWFHGEVLLKLPLLSVDDHARELQVPRYIHNQLTSFICSG